MIAQFAYNETSFFMIRLLQNFDKITIDTDAQPKRTTSLTEWETKRREVERDFLAFHLTLATKVCFSPRVCRFVSDATLTGRFMG